MLRTLKIIKYWFRIFSGSSAILTSKHMIFTDLHTSDGDLTYTLNSQPILGTLIVSDSHGETHILNYTHKLTQADLLRGLLTYNSNTEVGLKKVAEVLLFNVTDLSNNVLPNQVSLEIITKSLFIKVQRFLDLSRNLYHYYHDNSRKF